MLKSGCPYYETPFICSVSYVDNLNGVRLSETFDTVSVAKIFLLVRNCAKKNGNLRCLWYNIWSH